MLPFFKGKREISETNKENFSFYGPFFSYAEDPFQDNKNAKIQMIILKWFMC